MVLGGIFAPNTNTQAGPLPASPSGAALLAIPYSRKKPGPALFQPMME